MFARQPRAGEVKSRLQPAISAGDAARLYAAFVADSAALLASTAAEAKVVAFTGAGAATGLPALLEGVGSFDYWEQPEGTLGARMQALFASRFAAGATRIVLIGTDSPSLPASYVERAFELLREASVVLGPSTDGGYYLVGLSRMVSGLFDDSIAWGSGTVLGQSVAACTGERLQLLPPWYDVDYPQEAAFLRQHLRALRQTGETIAERSLAVLETLELPSPS